jgi:polysaccharide deacetylase 2 family uncharacterized protein YibQ
MKKRKKPTKNLILKVLFWSLMVAGGLWVAFAPRPHTHHPETVHVKVEPPQFADVTLPTEKPATPPPNALVEPKPQNEEKNQGDEKSQPETAQALSPSMPPPVRPVKSGAPEIALVIDDVGLDIKGSERATELPGFVTLSYMPYATRLREQTREARDKGHELLLHMPMEPVGNADPGPGALLTSLTPDEIRLRFQTALASFVGFDGVNNHMGSKFTSDSAGMEIVVDELKQRHLFFLDSRTSPKSVGFSVAREHALPTLARDVFLDDEQSAKAIREQLDQTEIIARRKGYAIAIGHPHAVTLQVLEQWIPEAQARGYKFAPLNTFIHIK